MSSTRSSVNKETKESTPTTPVTEVSTSGASTPSAPVTAPAKKKVMKKKTADKSMSSSAKRYIF